MLVFFCVTVVLFLFATSLLIWLICWMIAHLFQYRLRYALFGWSAGLLSFLFVACVVYGNKIGRFQINVHPTTYYSSAIPQSFDGYKIVHISDLHLSSFADSPSQLQRVIDSINAQQPDLICFTGDFVSFGIEEAMPFTTMLQQLHAKDGVVSVLGNHDFALYRYEFSSNERAKMLDQLVAYQRDTLEWKLLRNQYTFVVRGVDTMRIIGVDNAACGDQGFQTIYRADLGKAEQTPFEEEQFVQDAPFSLLLSHDPTHWSAEVLPNTSIPLTLSGHTHAGQAKIFGFPLSSLLFEQSMGWYESGDQSLYINTGIGCTLPVRIGVPAEITIITLSCES